MMELSENQNSGKLNWRELDFKQATFESCWIIRFFIRFYKKNNANHSLIRNYRPSKKQVQTYKSNNRQLWLIAVFAIWQESVRTMTKQCCVSFGEAEMETRATRFFYKNQ